MNLGIVNLRTVRALLNRDAKDVMRNMYIMTCFLIPVVSVALGVYLFPQEVLEAMGKEYLVYVSTILCMATIPVFLLPILVSEEKEKNTLRTLMLAGVSAGEFILSKVIVTWVMLIVAAVVNYFIIGANAVLLPWYLLCLTLGSAGILLLGVIIGMLCRDQMSTTIVVMPFMLLVTFPFFAPIHDVLANIAQAIPSRSTAVLYESMTGGELLSKDFVVALIVSILWIIVCAGICRMVYRRKMMD